MRGDGSDGALHVTSGQTVNLSLDRKYQFTSVIVDVGGTISTTDTTGSVLYIAAQGVISIAGTINVSGKVSRGVNSWSTVIDGITFTSPSCGVGGQGGNWGGQTAATQGAGFGGGGHGGIQSGAFGHGGNGGAGGGTGGAEAVGITTGSSTNNTVTSSGGNGGTSAGGGGGAYASVLTTGGTRQSTASAFGSGYGGDAYGNIGEDGWNPAGAFAVTPGVGAGGTISFGYMSLGGGGGGGNAGIPGVHVVLRATEVQLLASGLINTSGVAGGNGGNGGISYTDQGQNNARGGLGGGGGGGGGGGSISLYYGSTFTAAATVNRNGSVGGTGGLQGGSGTQTGSTGASATFGAYTATPADGSYGNMLAVFN